MSVVEIAEDIVQDPAGGGTDGLIHQSNLTYRGAFQLPPGAIGPTTFAYGGRGLTYSGRNSLFLVGHAYQLLTAEVSIPTPVLSFDVAGLPTATLLQTFGDPTDGHRAEIANNVPTTIFPGGQMVYHGRLIATYYVYYDANSPPLGTKSHFTHGLDLTASDGTGPWRLTTSVYSADTEVTGHVSGWMCPIPLPWQAALGGPALTGNGAIPVITRSSFGPAAYLFDPDRLGVDVPLVSIPLLDYKDPHDTLGAWDSAGQLFNGATAIGGMVFPEGFRSILFFGRLGTGATFCYGPNCYDPSFPNGEGPHNYPYVNFVWAFDAADLARVKNGDIAPWDVVPYATWQFPLPYLVGDNPAEILGVAYDPSTGRIFLTQAYADGNPLVHVFTIG